MNFGICLSWRNVWGNNNKKVRLLLHFTDNSWSSLTRKGTLPNYYLTTLYEHCIDDAHIALIIQDCFFPTQCIGFRLPQRSALLSRETCAVQLKIEQDLRLFLIPTQASTIYIIWNITHNIMYRDTSGTISNA